MSDYFEIDFLDVESPKSGDAIPLRYRLGSSTYVHVVDGGFQATGEAVTKHLANYYDSPHAIDHVVATHPDGDHAGGLRSVLETYPVTNLWMLRPWLYADELLPRFARFRDIDNLKRRLREVYPNIDALEEIAVRKNIPIRAPLQGARIGAFTVLAPSKARYLDLIVESERTPEPAQSEATAMLKSLGGNIAEAAARVANFIRAAWGAEVFSPNETSAENEMSVVQFADLCGKKILLTADAGRQALAEAIAFTPTVGVTLPGIDYFQVPHHGSRRNVSSQLLDQLLGPRLSAPATPPKFEAIISSAKADTDHPRKSVVRACYHRGARVVTTEGKTLCVGNNNPKRPNWVAAVPAEYPHDQEQ